MRRHDGHWISKRGLCADCAIRRESESVEQIGTKSGPFYDAYRAGMIEYAQELADETG